MRVLRQSQKFLRKGLGGKKAQNNYIFNIYFINIF